MVYNKVLGGPKKILKKITPFIVLFLAMPYDYKTTFIFELRRLLVLEAQIA